MNTPKKMVRKLVRDQIPEINRKRGLASEVTIAESGEHWQLLREKLSEEVQEFLESETIEELGDILEVIDAICQYKHISPEQLKETKEKKFFERGGFSRKYVVKFDV